MAEYELAETATCDSTGDGRHDRPPLSAVERYDIGEELGAGGIGVVYRARDTVLGRDVAIKILQRQPKQAHTDQLIAEAKSLARLSHPNVVAVHDAGRVGEQCFLVMELVTGGTLRERISRGLAPVDAIGFLLEAGRGLAAAHRAEIVHCDFKPSNVLVGDDGRVKVADFGLAVWSQPEDDAGERGANPRLDITASGIPAGTPAYLAPERFEGAESGPRADQFAFCLTLWEALHGTRPLAPEPRDLAALARAKRDGDLPPRRRPVSRRLYRLLQRGLAADPGARFASMDELLEELERCVRPKRWMWAAGGVVAASALAVVMALVTRGGDTVVTSGPTPAVEDQFAAFERRISDAATRLGNDHLEIANLHLDLAKAMATENGRADRIADHFEAALATFRREYGAADPRSTDAQLWLVYYRAVEGRSREMVPLARELVMLHDRDRHWKGWVEAYALLGRILYEAGELDEARAIGVRVWHEARDHGDTELRQRIEAFGHAHGEAHLIPDDEAAR